MVPDSKLAEICRFVRDTDSVERRRATLESRFGAGVYGTAEHRGFLARQVWQGKRTDHVDLTPAGESFLCDMARRQPAGERKLSHVSVFQDGANFYEDASGLPLEVEARAWTAPFRVRDFDMPAANRARDWFLAECAKLGIVPVFER